MKPTCRIAIAFFLASSASATAAVGDRKCGEIDIAHYASVFEVCATVVEETMDSATLRLETKDIRANGLLLGTRSRAAEKICQALGYKDNSFLRAGVMRSRSSGIIIAGASEGMEEENISGGKVATFSKVVCTE